MSEQNKFACPKLQYTYTTNMHEVGVAQQLCNPPTTVGAWRHLSGGHSGSPGNSVSGSHR